MNSIASLLEENKNLLAFTALGIAGGAAWYYGNKFSEAKRRFEVPTKWEEVGKVDDILIYSLKSAKSISVPTAEATDVGLKHGYLADRSILLMNEEGNMITGREAYKLVTMSTSLKNDNLVIQNLEGESVSINYNDFVNRNNKIIDFKIRGDPVQGVDCGDEVAEWMSKQLYDNKRKVRLVYIGTDKWDRRKRHLEYFDFPLFQKNDSARYFDSCTYMMASNSSLKELNGRLSKPVTMRYFRPSIVIGGAPPFDEDTYEFVKIGDKVIFHVAKPCERCILTQVNPDTGIINREHFETLLKYRTPKHPPELVKAWKHKPIFGFHCGIDSPGTINVGDKVYVSRAKKQFWHV